MDYFQPGESIGRAVAIDDDRAVVIATEELEEAGPISYGYLVDMKTNSSHHLGFFFFPVVGVCSLGPESNQILVAAEDFHLRLVDFSNLEEIKVFNGRVNDLLIRQIKLIEDQVILLTSSNIYKTNATGFTTTEGSTRTNGTFEANWENIGIQEKPEGIDLYNAIDGLSPDNLWVCGWNGKLLNLKDGSWKLIQTPSKYALYDGVAAEGQFYACGQVGLVTKGNEEFDLLTPPQEIGDLWGIEHFNGKIYCSHMRTLFEVTEGNSWEPVVAAREVVSDFYSLSSSQNTLWSFGQHETARLKNGTWEKISGGDFNFNFSQEDVESFHEQPCD